MDDSVTGWQTVSERLRSVHPLLVSQSARRTSVSGEWMNKTPPPPSCPVEPFQAAQLPRGRSQGMPTWCRVPNAFLHSARIIAREDERRRGRVRSCFLSPIFQNTNSKYWPRNDVAGVAVDSKRTSLQRWAFISFRRATIRFHFGFVSSTSTLRSQEFKNARKIHGVSLSAVVFSIS